MSFFDKLKDVTYINGFIQFLHTGSNEIFVASVIKISAFNKDVLDSEWSPTSRALRSVRELWKNVYSSSQIITTSQEAHPACVETEC